MSPRYTVIWRRYLVDRVLAEVVVQAMQRGENVQAITQAMAEVDRLLSLQPEEQGESRADYERVLIVSPLTVTFEVFEEEHIVAVIKVRYSPPRQ